MTREEAIQWLKVINTKEFGWDEFALQESQREIRERCEQGVREAIDMAIEALQADAENRLYIKIYADDEPSVKAEKLYQICGETQNREVSEWLKEYFPSLGERRNP